MKEQNTLKLRLKNSKRTTDRMKSICADIALENPSLSGRSVVKNTID